MNSKYLNNLKHHNRRSPRLPEYDYSQNGAYFVTICTHNKKILFENNQIKKIIEREWMNTPELRFGISLDKFVVMPNHLHGIIIIQRCKGVCNTPLRPQFRSPSKTIGSIIKGFKAATTSKINKIHHTSGLPVWQRNYYDHIIRNELDLSEKRKYICENPLKWDIDEYNPANLHHKKA